MAYGNQTRLSKCAAEWLSVSPFFTTNPISDNTPGEIRLTSTPTYSPEGVRFRFEVTDTNGLHQAQLLLPAALGELLSDCKQLEGEESTIEFISTELTIEPVDSVMLQIQAANVTLTLYDMRGVAVRQLMLGHQPAGVYRSKHRAAYWDGRNQHDEKVASGLYFYTFTAGEFTATRKMLIQK